MTPTACPGPKGTVYAIADDRNARLVTFDTELLDVGASSPGVLG
jgi:hypothetical protein